MVNELMVNDKMVNWFRLVRWKNLLFLAITMYALQRLVIVPLMYDFGFAPSDLFGGLTLMLLIVSVVLIAAGGYVINDYFDIKIDAINNPDNQIVSKDIPREKAIRCYQILTVCGAVTGIAAAVLLRSWMIGILIVFEAGLLWFYSSSYKRMLIVGNLIVAVSTALVPLIIAMANVAFLELRYTDLLYQTPIVPVLYRWMSGFALFAFLMTFTREIIKDLEDQVGDRELECHTIPVVLGDVWSKVIVVLLMAATIALLAVAYFSWIPFSTAWGSANANYMICFAVLWIVMLIMFVRSHRAAEYAVSSTMMKILMGWGMVYTIIFYIQKCQEIGAII